MLINVYIFQMRKETVIVPQCETPQTKAELDDLIKSSERTDRRVISSKYSPLSSTSLYNLTTSPLRYDSKSNQSLPRKRNVYKKLYSDDDTKKGFK